MLDTLIFRAQKTIDDLDSEEIIIIELYLILITLSFILAWRGIKTDTFFLSIL